VCLSQTRWIGIPHSFRTNNVFPTTASVVEFINHQEPGAQFKLPFADRCIPEEWQSLFRPHCVNVSVEQTCAAYTKGFNYAFNRIVHQSNECEVQLTTLIDGCLLIYNLVLRRNHGCHRLIWSLSTWLFQWI
jgi:hypothetical protein